MCLARRRGAVALGLMVLLGGGPAWAQNSTAGNRLPRTAEGKPDFSGIWQNLTTANWNIQDHTDSAEAPAGQGIVENNDIPYKPGMLAQRKANFDNRKTEDLTAVSCHMPGVPRATYMPHPFQITQDRGVVAIRYQFAHALRIISFEGKHPEGWPDFWMGDSRGRWEGNTLVVDVRMIDERTWFDHSGNFHSPALHVVERYSEIDRDHILYEATINDPDVFTRPWKMRFPLYRRVEKDVRLLEHECQWFKSEEKYKNATPFKPPAQ